MNWIEARAIRDANSRVYFAQPTHGGPVKVGLTSDLENRSRTLAAWHPQGVEVIVSIPGGRIREAALKWLFKDVMLMGEWMRACPVVWRVICEIEEKGDLAWLPVEQALPAEALLGREIVGFYGSREKAAAALGCSVTSIPATRERKYGAVQGFGCTFGRWLIERQRHAGLLPAYLRPLSANDDSPREAA